MSRINGVLLALVLTGFYPPIASADSEILIEGGNAERRLLEDSVIYRPGEELRSEDQARVAVPRASDEGPSLPAVRSGDLGGEVAFATSTRSESLSQLRQAVTALPGGGYAVVWVDGDFPDRDVRMQWLGSDGERLFEPEGRVVADLADTESSAVAAPHSTAGAFVAFVRQEAPGSVIYVQSFDASGLPRWPGDGVPPGIGSGQGNPHLVPDPDGGVFVCWDQGSGGLATVAPWCQHLSSSGSKMWGAEGLSAGGQPGLRVLPRGVADGAGGLLVFWRNHRDVSDGTVDPMLMEGQHFTGDGTRLWGDAGLLVRTTNLEEANGYSFNFFNVVPDGEGGAVLGFNDWVEMSAPNLDVVAQRVAGDGTLLWGDGSAVAATAEHHQHEATVAAPDGGAFVVAYESIGSTRSKLWVYRLGADGTHLWSATGLELSDPDATALDYGAYGLFAQRLLRLVWTHQRFPATFEMDVHFAQYTLSGQRLGGAGGLPVTTVLDAQFVNGFAYSPEARRMLAVWDDRRKGTWDDLDVYGSLFLSGVIFADGFESGDTSAWSSGQ